MGDEKRKRQVENQLEEGQKSSEAKMRRTETGAKMVVEEYEKNDYYNLFDYQHNSHLQINDSKYVTPSPSIPFINSHDFNFHRRVVSEKQVAYPSRNEQGDKGSDVILSESKNEGSIKDQTNTLQSTNSDKIQIKKEIVLRKQLKRTDFISGRGLRVLDEPFFVRLNPHIPVPATLTLNDHESNSWVMELVERKNGRYITKGWRSYAVGHELKIGDTVIIERTQVRELKELDFPKTGSNSSSDWEKPEEFEVLHTKYDITIERVAED